MLDKNDKSRSTYRHSFGLTSCILLGFLLLDHVSVAFTNLSPAQTPGDSFSNSDAPAQWLTKLTRDWMSQLPDEVKLNQISIPGTHDTGALFGSRFCETQSWSITEQLEAGIRYFDIRNRRANDVFAIHHGICFQKIFFGGVMEQIEAFLKKYPSETLVMRVKEEHTPVEGSLSFKEIWERYMVTYDYLFVPDLGSKMPTMKEMRGKILVLRNAAFSGYGIQYDGPLTNIQDFYKVHVTPKEFPYGEDTVNLRQKKAFIQEFLDKAETSSKVVLNHCSGAVGMFPDSVARETNPYAYQAIGDHIRKKQTGIVIMDYPGEPLIYRIIQTNFARASPHEVVCKSETWRVDSDETYAKFQMPDSPEGKEITIKKGSHSIGGFPSCHRVKWSNLKFLCRSNGKWKVTGSWDADGFCRTHHDSQKYLAIGYK